MRFRSLLASLPVLLASTSAPGEPAVELVWVETTGVGTPGTSSIEAEVGDRVTLVMNVLADADGVIEASVDLAFDTGLTPNPGLVQECFFVTVCIWENTTTFWTPTIPGVSLSPNSIESFDASGPVVNVPDSLELARVEFQVDAGGELSVDVAYLGAFGIVDGSSNVSFPVATATVVPAPGPPPITSPFQTLASADVTAEFEGAVGSRTVEDEIAAKGNKITAGVGNQATPERFEIGTLPPGADVKALAVRPTTGEVLFALDVPATLPGVAFAEPRDLLEYDPVAQTYGKALDGAAAGVPPGVSIDAVLIGPSQELFVSLDTSADFGAKGHADDEDLIEVESSTSLDPILDLSQLGFDPRLDLDAVSSYDETTGDLITFSFDTAGTIDGTRFEDEDGVTTFDLDDPLFWFVIHDGSERFDAWNRADLDAVHFVPEPGLPLGLLCGAALLARLHRSARRSRDRHTTRRRSS